LERIQKVPQKGAWQAKKGKKPRLQHCVLTSPFYPRAEVEGFSFCFVVVVVGVLVVGQTREVPDSFSQMKAF
jgi:hypothetical protein